MKKNTEEENMEALNIVLQSFNPTFNMGENIDKYVSLYCYTATSSYALGLTPDERHKTIYSMRLLFDYFYDLTIEKTGKYHEQWEKYCITNYDNHCSSAMLHHSKANNFTEGKSFVCLGFPSGYYFDKNEPGQEFGEISYVIHGMYNFLQENSNYASLLYSNEIKRASELYESILRNPNNRRVFLKMRVKKSDVEYVTQNIRDDNRATEENINKAIAKVIITKIPEALALKDDYRFAEPLGNCCYKLCEDIVEINEPEKEREMAIKYLDILLNCIK